MESVVPCAGDDLTSGAASVVASASVCYLPGRCFTNNGLPMGSATYQDKGYKGIGSTIDPRENWRPSDYLKLGWTQRAEARDECGEPVDPSDPHAIRWCLQGAIIASGEMGYNWAITTKKHCVGAAWNDRSYRKQSEVLAVVESMERELSDLPAKSSEPEPDKARSRWRMSYWSWDGSLDVDKEQEQSNADTKRV